MKIRAIVNSVILIIVIGFFSCTSETTYEIKIENKTNYQLDSLYLGAGTVLTISPKNESRSFRISRINNLANFFSEPLLSVWVKSYSDSTLRYTNNVGHVISFSSLNDREINQIIVTNDNNPHHESDKFKFTTKKDTEQNDTQQ